MKNVNSSISDMFALAIQAQKTKDLHSKQVLKMKAGKVHKVLAQANQESIDRRSGVKLSN